MPAQDRSPSAYEHISVQPLSGALGAEIHGVDLSNPVSDEVFTEIHRAFLDHLVIFSASSSSTRMRSRSLPRGLAPSMFTAS